MPNDLLAKLLAEVESRVPGVEIVNAKTYIRLVANGRTAAYVNGTQRPRIGHSPGQRRVRAPADQEQPRRANRGFGDSEGRPLMYEPVGLKELERVLGVSKPSVLRYVGMPSFPTPTQLAGGRVWDRAAVEQWARENLPLPVGRPRKEEW